MSRPNKRKVSKNSKADDGDAKDASVQAVLPRGAERSASPGVSTDVNARSGAVHSEPNASKSSSSSVPAAAVVESGAASGADGAVRAKEGGTVVRSDMGVANDKIRGASSDTAKIDLPDPRSGPPRRTDSSGQAPAGAVHVKVEGDSYVTATDAGAVPDSKYGATAMGTRGQYEQRHGSARYLLRLPTEKSADVKSVSSLGLTMRGRFEMYSGDAAVLNDGVGFKGPVEVVGAVRMSFPGKSDAVFAVCRTPKGELIRVHPNEIKTNHAATVAPSENDLADALTDVRRVGTGKLASRIIGKAASNTARVPFEVKGDDTEDDDDPDAPQPNKENKAPDKKDSKRLKKRPPEKQLPKSPKKPKPTPAPATPPARRAAVADDPFAPMVKAMASFASIMQSLGALNAAVQGSQGRRNNADA